MASGVVDHGGLAVCRFAQHEQVVGQPGVRLFVSTPLKVSSGACVGTLCGPFTVCISCSR